jgi:hypothetical protein
MVFLETTSKRPRKQKLSVMAMAKKYWSYVHLLEISSSIGTQIGQTGNW